MISNKLSLPGNFLSGWRGPRTCYGRHPAGGASNESGFRELSGRVFFLRFVQESEKLWQTHQPGSSITLMQWVNVIKLIFKGLQGL